MATIPKLRLLSKKSHTLFMFARLASTSTQQRAAASISRKVVDGEGFWKKNERMQRPMSPHLTIYKFELPVLLSGTHRATGFAMSGMVMGVGAAALLLPNSAETYIEAIRALDLPLWVLAPAKFAMVFPLCYHTVNGLRHLLWDTGRGFEMGTLYKTGYFALATSVGAALAIVFYCST